MEIINNLELRGVVARMNDKATNKQTLLVERYEIERIADYIDLVEDRLQGARRENQLLRADFDFINGRLNQYEKNVFCRVCMVITDKCRALKRWIINAYRIHNNKPKIRYTFKLKVEGDE